MLSVLKQYLPAKVVLTAVLVAVLIGLLFEGVMIGPEYLRYKPPFLMVIVSVLFAVFFVWLSLRETDR